MKINVFTLILFCLINISGYAQNPARPDDTLLFKGNKTYRQMGDVDKESVWIILYPDSTCSLTMSTKRNKQNTNRDSYTGTYSISGKEIVITTNQALPAYNGKYTLRPNHLIFEWKVKPEKPVIKVKQHDGFHMKIKGSKPIRKFRKVAKYKHTH